jgi:hypothetical protein
MDTAWYKGTVNQWDGTQGKHEGEALERVIGHARKVEAARRGEAA